ncbi:F-box-like protein [Ceratobasidium sp. AG-Ba]|nr:F-box-like protein [Ceratobasidium sp. AG-Ba]QRV98839.1 F-box-like protein [Ceratobasidium sp. AG-Ba]
MSEMVDPDDIYLYLATLFFLETSYDTTGNNKDTLGNNGNHSGVTSGSLPLGPAVIHKLPYELLFYVFKIAAQSSFTDAYLNDEEDEPEKSLEYLPFPCVLSSVCRSWYSIARASPILWSYIQLVASGEYRDRFYNCATHMVKHTSNVPLSIQIHQPVSTGRRIVHRLTNWLARVANRVQTIRFSDAKPACDLVQPVLYACIVYSDPSVVPRLSVWHPETGRAKFIHPSLSFNSQPWRIVVSSSRTELFFESSTTLTMDNIFVQWDGQVFPRVTHLEMRDGSISEKQLMILLSNTPNLSHLSFSFNVKRAYRKTAQTPVSLPKLEVLNLVGVKPSQVWSILRLLEPGTTPLALALEIGGSTDNLAEMPEVNSFLYRSTISSCRLRVVGELNQLWFPKFLQHLSGIHTLCLENHSYIGAYPLLTPDVCLRLRVLCMKGCNVDLSQLRKLLETHSIQVLRLLDCRMFAVKLETHTLDYYVSQLVPDAKCYTGIRTPDIHLGWWDHVSS